MTFGLPSRRGLLLAALVALAPRALPAQQGHEGAAESFTLQAVMSAPFATELVAAPNGRAVAWLGDEEGKRNVWVAEAPAWRARRLTRYLEDDGQELTGLVWTADSRAVCYSRGGDSGSNWDRTVPVNPTSDPAGTEQSVWVAPLRGVPRRIGEGHFPVPSPRSDQIVWFLRDTLRIAPLLRPGRPQILIKERGSTDVPVWSPDGRRIAFTSRRRDHSLIGVYDLRAKTISWVSPGTFRDDMPRWSPDGTRLAFVRRAGQLIGAGPGLAGPRGQGDQAGFAIRVADLATFESREIYRSPAGAENGLANEGEWSFMWAQGDRLLFATEGTGWLGLYAIPAAGGEATRLTPTGCEIQDVVLARDGASLLYASNCGDIDRRHVQRVDVAGGPPRDVTAGRGIEVNPGFLEDGKVALLKGDARHPGTPAIADSQSVNVIEGFAPPAEFPADVLVEPQQVIVRSADSLEIHCQLFLPPDSAAGRMPAVIFFHGGPSREMLLGWHMMGYYFNSYAFNQYLASRGFIVLSVNYRGGVGYGRAFRTAARRGRFGASEYADVMAAAQYLRGRVDVDTAHVGLWGGSYGGYLTGLGLARNSDLFAAGFDLHGVYDYAEESNLSRATGASDSAIAAARRNSPIGDVEHWRSPVLLVAGDDDRNVHFLQTVDMANRLRRQGVHVEELIFVDDTHHFLKHANWVAAYRAGAAFLAEQLRR
ncbi:MAG: S9 family peptidase [Gemmatimonadales bacterium]